MTDLQDKLALTMEQFTLAGGVDFHLHSTCSDGELSPSELVKRAFSLHLKAFSLTDHDTLAGLEEVEATLSSLVKKCQDSQVAPKFIPGIEISSEIRGVEVHILAYFAQQPAKSVYDLSRKLRQQRSERNKKMLEKVRRLGINLADFPQDRKSSQDEVWGRANLARVIVANNHQYESVDQVFKEVLSKDMPGYVRRKLYQATYVIKQIRQAGGIAVLAHPQEYAFSLVKNDNNAEVDSLRSVLLELKNSGLSGIEAFHGRVNSQLAQEYFDLSRELDLIVTQGSDAHEIEENAKHSSMFNGSTNLYKKFIKV